jgi:hypothetical protein
MGKNIDGFLRGNLKEGDHVQDPDIDGRIILKWIFKKWNGDMDCTDLSVDRDKWLAVVNAVINFKVAKTREIF